jgi:hypothetical protein
MLYQFEPYGVPVIAMPPGVPPAPPPPPPPPPLLPDDGV